MGAVTSREAWFPDATTDDLRAFIASTPMPNLWTQRMLNHPACPPEFIDLAIERWIESTWSHSGPQTSDRERSRTDRKPAFRDHNIKTLLERPMIGSASLNRLTTALADMPTGREWIPYLLLIIAHPNTAPETRAHAVDTVTTRLHRQTGPAFHAFQQQYRAVLVSPLVPPELTVALTETVMHAVHRKQRSQVKAVNTARVILADVIDDPAFQRTVGENVASAVLLTLATPD